MSCSTTARRATKAVPHFHRHWRHGRLCDFGRLSRLRASHRALVKSQHGMQDMAFVNQHLRWKWHEHMIFCLQISINSYWNLMGPLPHFSMGLFFWLLVPQNCNLQRKATSSGQCGTQCREEAAESGIPFSLRLSVVDSAEWCDVLDSIQLVLQTKACFISLNIRLTKLEDHYMLTLSRFLCCQRCFVTGKREPRLTRLWPL